MGFFFSQYRLNKSRQILQWCYTCFKKKRKDLSPQEIASVEYNLEALEKACRGGDRQQADDLARKLEKWTHATCKKTIFGYFKEIFFALIFALIIATLVRQIWFEPYEIPTGSMRPTFEEQDHLLVSKTTFGINYPLETKHLYFDPTLVQRTGVFIFSGDGINLQETDSTYLGIFPYKKRYIKRCIGKPGDTLYFYGGKIYGIDKNGQDISQEFNTEWMAKLDHIPFISFEGRRSFEPGQKGSSMSEMIFKQMDQPIAKISLKNSGEVEGTIFDGTSWVKEHPNALKSPHETIQAYSDFWGIGNYAMARLLTKEQARGFSEGKEAHLDGILYLELHHHPSVTYPKPRFVRDEHNNYDLLLTPYSTLIPLQQSHLDAIMDNIYTARFIVEQGRARKYSAENHRSSMKGPAFPGVPDGCYELYYGKAYEVLWGGILRELPKDHPLLKRNPENIQKLYNLGIEMLTLYEPHAENQIYLPARYAYFREGDLYLLGAPVIKKEDETLVAFNAREQSREQKSSQAAPYIAFKDNGPPIKEGVIDTEFMKSFGITLPEKSYLALGDNHAMSADSRYFGFVPQNNIQGSPSLILWPPGSRWGCPAQKPYPWLTAPTVIVWTVALIILCAWYLIHRRNLRRPIILPKD